VRKPKISPELRSAVRAHLMARAYAETMRERVNAIYLEILAEAPIYAERHEGRRGSSLDGRPILDPQKLYLASEEDMPLVEEAWAEADKRSRAAGIKPDDMPHSHCPALVAEALQIKTEWLVIEAGARMMGMEDPEEFNDRLLCLGLEKRKEFLDLLCGLIVNESGFCNPLTVSDARVAGVLPED